VATGKTKKGAAWRTHFPFPVSVLTARIDQACRSMDVSLLFLYQRPKKNTHNSDQTETYASDEAAKAKDLFRPASFRFIFRAKRISLLIGPLVWRKERF
jgi:hypothetical protein